MTPPHFLGSLGYRELAARVLVDGRDGNLLKLADKFVGFAIGGLRARLAFRTAQLGFGVRVQGHAPVIQNLGLIEIGDHVFFDAPRTAAYFDVEPGALLSIGAGSYINDGVWIGATQSVQIGARARIGPGVRIMDNAYHDLHHRGVRPPSRPVVIEDDVWIASDSMINPGVHIGRGAVVGAHSLVTHDVPSFTVVGGVPARELRELDPVAVAWPMHPRSA